MSTLISSPLLAKGFIKASNFVNIKKENPKQMSILFWDCIVLDKKDLKANKWLYLGNEEKDLIKKQMKIMEEYKDWTIIVE